uniref:DUF3500 domain-containing protein n=1 Tax=Solibacter usitatus (strain Ellin6076) TaxID=234267 RepID=Q01U93_SOLUE
MYNHMNLWPLSRQRNCGRTAQPASAILPLPSRQHSCTLYQGDSPMAKTALLGTIVILCCALAPAQSSSNVTPAIVAGANAFLGSLDDAQRAKVLFDFNDAAQRVKWSNLPTTMVPRAGLKMGDLSAPQRNAAMALLAAALSKRGYEKVLAIIEGDEQLKVAGGGRGGAMFGRDLFYISILGKPSLKDPWMLQFGGHHLALNLTIVGPEGILTPSLTAAQPAKYTVDGKTVRPLGAENDKAFALINALDEAQRKQAILNYKVADLVLGPGQDGKTIQPEGLKCSAMNASQQAMLLELAGEWAGIVNDKAAAARMAEIKANLAATWFAWSGPTTNGAPAYYRIQGPTLVIEYAPQPLGGDPTMHIHTIYRDPTNDYGKKSAGH